MKAILVIDVPILDDGKHLCNECPIWSGKDMFCEYNRNMETKGCSLKPLPKRFGTDIEDDYAKGWNDCLDLIERESNG